MLRRNDAVRHAAVENSRAGSAPERAASPLPTRACSTKPPPQASWVIMFNWFQRLLPRPGDFFGMFEAHAATIVGAAAAMTKLVDGGTPHKEHIAEIDRREHEADDIIREVLRSVRRTFLTPFDRGAITSLIASMDDAVDEMQATARAIDLYQLSVFEPDMKQMVAIIAEAASLIAEAMPMLRDISRNGARIHVITERVVRLEGDADDFHAKGLKLAFAQHANSPMQFIVAREIYKHLERITDAMEDVANEIDGIVIDHA
jgi:predicted phosphate transport protein (TIGR00153 family)